MSSRESKTERFRRVAEARVNKIIKMVRLLGNCSRKGTYEYDESQVQKIFFTLRDELNKAHKRFLAPERKGLRFSLTSPEEPEKRELPTMEILLPDDSVLRAVAFQDGDFPTINIYHVPFGGEKPVEICFAEFNPERNAGHQLCIGAYQSDDEDTKYYEPYEAERK